VDDGEGPRSGSLLLDPGVSGRLSEHSSLGEEDDVSVRELLLELSGQPEGQRQEKETPGSARARAPEKSPLQACLLLPEQHPHPLE
jgi:hypothetical protein